jgi:pSer/pThr/pTyr-binding forkhead associated (FHA) protein
MELEHEGEVIVLAVPDAVLGRTSASEIQVSHPLVSRRHCRLEATRDGVYLEDLGSSNGTFLNGERLAERRSVRPGDVIQIGHEGPRLTLLLATVDGRDVAGSLTGEDQQTMLAGDPRAAGMQARIAVSEEAAAPEAPAADAGEAPTRESTAPMPASGSPATTSIPVAEPIGNGGESFLGRTDVVPVPPRGPAAERGAEPPTRAVASPAPAAAPPADATQPVAPQPGADDATRPVAPRTVPKAAPLERPQDPPPQPEPEPTDRAPVATPPRGRGRGVVLGFVLGLVIVIACGVLTSLGSTLHSLAPWSRAALETTR